jgi:hypothetical protein
MENQLSKIVGFAIPDDELENIDEAINGDKYLRVTQWNCIENQSLENRHLRCALSRRYLQRGQFRYRYLSWYAVTESLKKLGT